MQHAIMSVACQSFFSSASPRRGGGRRSPFLCGSVAPLFEPLPPIPPVTPMFRWGLIGAGDIARKRVAPAMRESPGSELVAVSRARSELAESFAKEFGARRWHPRWQDLVSDPEIDGVYVATTVDVHAEQTIAAAQAGKHVLCEK